MNETQLQNLLHQTDQTLRPTALQDPSDLASRARRQAARQTRRRATLLCSATGLLLLTAVLTGITHRRHEQQRLAFEADMQTQLAQLQTEARQTLALIQQANEQLKLQQKNAELQTLLASIETRAQQMQSRTEQLAAQLYEKAQTLSQEENTESVVCDLYQRIVQTFPETSYSALAQQALAQLDCNSSPQS